MWLLILLLAVLVPPLVAAWTVLMSPLVAAWTVLMSMGSPLTPPPTWVSTLPMMYLLVLPTFRL